MRRGLDVGLSALLAEVIHRLWISRTGGTELLLVEVSDIIRVKCFAGTH